MKTYEDRLVSAVLKLQKGDDHVVYCPKCGQLEYIAKEMRRADDPDFLLGMRYLCRECGASAETRIAERRPRQS